VAVYAKFMQAGDYWDTSLYVPWHSVWCANKLIIFTLWRWKNRVVETDRKL